MEIFTPIGGYNNLVLTRDFPSLRNRGFSTQIGSKNAIWLDTSNLWMLYKQIPHLNNCINLDAKLLSTGKLRHFKGDPNDIINATELHGTSFLKLMKKPNPLQNYVEFTKQWCIFLDIYENAAIYKLKGTRLQEIPTCLWNLPPQHLKVIPTGKIFNQSKITGIIEEYILNYAGTEIPFTTDEVVLKNNNIGDSYITSDSRIYAIIKPLSNIVAALQTANKLIGEHGAYGILSNDTKDAIGNIGLRNSERKKIEKALHSDYGNLDHQRQTILSNAALRYQPISFPMKDMMLDNEIEQDAGIVYDTWTIDRDNFSSVKGGANNSGGSKREALKNTYQNATIPKAEDYADFLSEHCGLWERGEFAIITYDHLPIMQENKKEAALANASTINALSKAFQDGALSKEEYKKYLPKFN